MRMRRSTRRITSSVSRSSRRASTFAAERTGGRALCASTGDVSGTCAAGGASRSTTAAAVCGAVRQMRSAGRCEARDDGPRDGMSARPNVDSRDPFDSRHRVGRIDSISVACSRAARRCTRVGVRSSDGRMLRRLCGRDIANHIGDRLTCGGSSVAEVCVREARIWSAARPCAARGSLRDPTGATALARMNASCRCRTTRGGARTYARRGASDEILCG